MKTVKTQSFIRVEAITLTTPVYERANTPLYSSNTHWYPPGHPLSHRQISKTPSHSKQSSTHRLRLNLRHKHNTYMTKHTFVLWRNTSNYTPHNIWTKLVTPLTLSTTSQTSHNQTGTKNNYTIFQHNYNLIKHISNHTHSTFKKDDTIRLNFKKPYTKITNNT